jgi:quercetin dioxygenase-like cupin family protein
MEIRPSGSAASRRAPADSFTGAVWQDPIVEPPSHPSPASGGGSGWGNVRASLVHFEPGARTAWHTHPAGQTLYILSGVGRVQSVGGPIRDVRAGDVVWFAPNEKHWHGAGPQTTMAHVAITEVRDGKFVEWLEKVSDQQYQAAAG